jgi:hypothetical protein
MKQVGVWEITVAGYGAFQQVATEEQAESVRSAKARWEAGVGTKKRVREATGVELARWNDRGAYDPADDESEKRKLRKG